MTALTPMERLAALGGGSAHPPALDVSVVARKARRWVGIDQSFNATGVVWLESGDGAVTIVRAKTLVAEAAEGETGTMKMLTQAKSLADQLKAEDLSGDVVIFEQPPLGKGLHESSVPLLSALSVIIALDETTPVTAMHSGRWKSVVGGTGRGKKSAHATLPYIKGLRGLEKVTNESQRDALCIGLAWMVDHNDH